MPDLFTITITGYIAKKAPHWLEDLRSTLLDKGKATAIAKGKDWLDEEKQQRLLQQILQKAVKRGLARFRKQSERDQYRAIMTNLFEPAEHSDALRRAAMTLFSLADTPDLAELNAIYNQSLRTRNLSQSTPPADVDAAPYLLSFFEALLVELYDNSFFKSQISDVIQTRAALVLPEQAKETNTTLHKIHATIRNDYTDEQFHQDVATYTASVERTLRNLKIVGFLPKDYNRDPEINGIFIPLHVALSEQHSRVETRQADSLVALLQQHPHLVLLGDPGSGKSTTVRHLAWSHAWANLPASQPGDLALLPDHPLPLRIELRLFMQDSKHHPDYSFVSYATDVLMKRAINPLMFERLLTQQHMLILFDGLDEVTTLDERQRLVQEIEHFVQRYPSSYTLVTSRPVGYNLASCSERLFAHANVQGFDDDQVHQFLERWYTYVLGLSPLPDSEQQELETLFTTLKENPRLRKLAANPLLLTVITGLYRSQRLPEKRVQVYDKCAELLLETWARLKGTHARWTSMKMGREDQFACVAHLGFQLHLRSQEANEAQNGSRPAEETAADVPAKVMRKEVEHFLSNGKLITEVAEQRKEAELFLRLMQEEAGLIVERGTDENGESIYGFVHRTFQEYFAAADVYGRFEQDEDPSVISDFLIEHLHDLHWREVILLLLGKLGRKRATLRLRQILDGKIKSRRSLYTDILQQDLFFVCDCLIDEMDVESDLAEMVVSHVGDLVITSPISRQRTNALNKLGRLMRTRQFASLGKSEVVRLVTLDTIIDVNLKIQIARSLCLWEYRMSGERKLATMKLFEIAQCPNLTIGQAIEAAQALYLSGSEKWKWAEQRLWQMAQRSDLTIEQAIKAAQALYDLNPPESEMRKLAEKQLLQIAQRPDLTIEQAIQAAQSIYHGAQGPKYSEERKLVSQLLLQIAQRPDLTIEQVIQVAEALYESNELRSEEGKLATQLLLQIARRPDVTIEQAIQVAEALYLSSESQSEEERLAAQQLLQIVRQPDLTVEQTIKAAQALYASCKSQSEEERLATQLLLQIAQRPDLEVEQYIQAMQALYESFRGDSREGQQATQLFWQLAQDTRITASQRLDILTIPIAKYGASYKDKLQAIQELLLVLPAEQITDYLDKYWPEGYYPYQLKQVPDIVALLEQELLPPRVRDQIFSMLNSSIPQFNQISL